MKFIGCGIGRVDRFLHGFCNCLEGPFHCLHLGIRPLNGLQAHVGGYALLYVLKTWTRVVLELKLAKCSAIIW
jgi:hypothetical protein